MPTKLSAETLDDLRIVTEPEAIALVNVSPMTWARMRLRGDAPPLVRISKRRIGYRVSDLKQWIKDRLESSKTDPARFPEHLRNAHRKVRTTVVA